MTKIMIIRHAEKPTPDGAFRGVTVGGNHDKHDLSVRGWQRAGALVRFFAPHGGTPASPISTPSSIFASAATPASPSLRAKHTVLPLAEVLGLAVHTHHADGEEYGVALAALAAVSPVLIAWHHHSIPELVRHIAGDVAGSPPHWPDHRYDLVWVLDRDADGAWSFSQTTQRLFAHDPHEPA